VYSNASDYSHRVKITNQTSCLLAQENNTSNGRPGHHRPSGSSASEVEPLAGCLGLVRIAQTLLFDMREANTPTTTAKPQNGVFDESPTCIRPSRFFSHTLPSER